MKTHTAPPLRPSIVLVVLNTEHTLSDKFIVKVFAKRYGTLISEPLSRLLMCQTQVGKSILVRLIRITYLVRLDL